MGHVKYEPVDGHHVAMIIPCSTSWVHGAGAKSVVSQYTIRENRLKAANKAFSPIDEFSLKYQGNKAAALSFEYGQLVFAKT